MPEKHDKQKYIILRTTAYGESDLVVQVLTALGGKVSLFAKGALKSKKRFAGGVLEPTHFVEAVVRHTQAGAMSWMQEATLIAGFAQIRSSYEKLQLAFHLLQVVTKVAQEGDENSPELFDLLGNSLRALETSENLPLLGLQFEVKVLAMQGILPALEHGPELLKFAIRDHAKILLSTDQLRSLRNQTTPLLSEYLGLKPT